MNGKLNSTFFLKIVAFLIGIAVLAVCVYWLIFEGYKKMRFHHYFLHFVFNSLLKGFCYVHG